jgi:hypothetical protein
MIEAKLYARLKTVAANVYPLAAPKGYKSPAVIYQRVTTVPDRDLDEDLHEEAWIDFQIDVYSPSHIEALTLAKTIRTCMKTWQDEDVHTVAYISFDDTIDNTTEVPLYRVIAFYKLYATN